MRKIVELTEEEYCILQAKAELNEKAAKYLIEEELNKFNTSIYELKRYIKNYKRLIQLLTEIIIKTETYDEYNKNIMLKLEKKITDYEKEFNNATSTNS
jgi:predicted  nucleic acid-binding Zn-ribbon protein